MSIGMPGPMVVEMVALLMNWPFAAALSTVLLAATVTLYWIGDRFFGLGRLWGAR